MSFLLFFVLLMASISSGREKEPAMLLCLDSMMSVKNKTGENPPKLVYGYVDGKKTPCMTEYEFRVKYSQQEFDKTRKPSKKKDRRQFQREAVYKGHKKLANADLRGFDLQGLDLQGADLRNAQLESADLRGANLRNAKLNGAVLTGAYCRNADFQGADLTGAKISGSFFHYANLRNVEGLTVEQLGSTATLYKVHMEEPVLKILQSQYPSKMKKPKGGWAQKVFDQEKDSIPLAERADPQRFK
jgi:hypothetical protein